MMKGNNNTPVEVPQELIDQSKARVIDTARFLRKIRDDHPDEFQATVKKMKIGLRKAHHLAQIDKKLGKLNIAAERVRSVWAGPSCRFSQPMAKLKPSTT